MSAEPAVVVDSLVKRYDENTAVDGLSFTVAASSITSLLGPNGAGKTTTIECCEGFRRPDAGSVAVLGLDPWRDGPALRRRVGVMLQEGAGLYPGARAVELITHLASLHAAPVDVGDLVERLGLHGTGRTPVRRLSGGQRRRVALAAALVGRPDVVFLDEPTAGLDPQARHATWELLQDLRADGVTIVLTTHHMDEAERLSDHVGIIDAGRLVTAGSPAELTAGASGVVVQGPPRLRLESLRSALPAAASVREVTPGRYRVEGDVDPQLLATLTSWCAANGVLAQGLEVGTRSLEDVYLDVTGRTWRG